MRLASLLKKGILRGAATATPAIFATSALIDLSTVATVATVAVAKRDELAANDPEPPSDPQAWRELAAAYYAHHFNCPTCIAAGCGSRYGQRCGAGMALWRAYCD
jgi:hypothetical protein